jgi:hypothetical protein
VIAAPRQSMLALLVVLLAALTALAATPRVDDVQAVSYKACTLSDSDADPPADKPTYNLTIKRSGVPCSTAKKVVDAFHRCRSTTSASCEKKLLAHWRCTGKKESSMPLLFYGTLACAYGKRRVRSSYQQNT